MTTHKEITSQLLEIANEYPPSLVTEQVQSIKRIAFNVGLVTSRKGTSCRICDLGGGIGLFSIGCAAIGMQAVLIDDFKDEINTQQGETVLNLHKSHGVQVISRDVINDGIDFPSSSFDVVTTFDSMEHWHHSPKRLLASVVNCLAPGGLFILAAPNCVNLRKRLTIPFGIGAWSKMKDWYEPNVFRGHVREPSVSDLRYIARDMNLANVSILGRNWLGHASTRPGIAALTLLTDGVLTHFPSLCSTIYLIGTKP